MKILADGKYIARDGGGTWPTPMDHPDGGLEWRLRYANPEQLVKDRFLAASVVSAYRELINLPMRQRQKVIGDLRDAIEASHAQNSGDANG